MKNTPGMEAISSASYKKAKVKKFLIALLSVLFLYTTHYFRKYPRCDHGS
jgi:hypothetical protein